MPPRPYILLCLGLLCICAAAMPAYPQEEEKVGHRLVGNTILVDQVELWENWDKPIGALIIQPDGTLVPRQLATDINAVFNAETDTLIARINSAGTNIGAAPQVLDRDLSTYWEPERDAALDSWSLEINLGRAVSADRIVVRFVPEGQGDPFLNFRVLVSDGRLINSVGGRQQFFRAGLVEEDIKDQRDFTFTLEPFRKVPEGVTDATIQFIRIDALDTDGPRAEAITRAAFLALPEEDRGTIDYFLTTIEGRQIRVDSTTYFRLDPAERGAIVHYRHERPRLAEVEVFAEGENIVAITQAERERLPDQGKFEFRLFSTLTDGSLSSGIDLLFYNAVEDEDQVEIDLGAKYWLNRIKLLSAQRPPLAYQLRMSDGSLDANGSFVWTTFDERRNLERFLQMQESFPLQEVRYIELRQLEFAGSRAEKGNLGEIQAFGAGYVSEITLTSPFIRLGRPRLFTTVEWEGDQPPDTQIEVRTRTGEEVTLLPHYFTGFGQNRREISRNLWERLPEDNRPPPEIEEITGPDWSNWSLPYRVSGEPFKSPSPRPLARIQVRLLSRRPLAAAQLRRLRLRISPPLVENFTGEIWPAWGVEPGVEQDFTVYLRPRFVSDNPGFDRMVLRSSSSVPHRAGLGPPRHPGAFGPGRR